MGEMLDMKMVSRMMIFCMTIVAVGCGGRMPEDIGVSQGKLAPCPAKPNCVSSFAEDVDHQIASLTITGNPVAAWKKLRSLIEADGSAEIVNASDDYMHAVYTSTIMRYRDDVEFVLRAADGEIAVRSASRVGYGDMGVNRGRVDAIRDQLAQ